MFLLGDLDVPIGKKLQNELHPETEESSLVVTNACTNI